MKILKGLTHAPTNIKALSQLCKHIKKTVKVIEYASTVRGKVNLERVFEPLKDTLECLCTEAIPKSLPDSILDWNFPKLRVMVSSSWFTGPGEASTSWLQSPMFQNIRTVVTEFFHGGHWWKRALRMIDEEAKRALVKALESNGIQCHAMTDLTFDEILEWDCKLNGQIK